MEESKRRTAQEEELKPSLRGVSTDCIPSRSRRLVEQAHPDEGKRVHPSRSDPVSHRFHECLAAVANDLQWQEDSFTPNLVVMRAGDVTVSCCGTGRVAQALLSGRGVAGNKSFELQRNRERQMHEFQSERLVLRPPDRGA